MFCSTERIFGLEDGSALGRARPWQNVVGAVFGKAVVADADNLILLVDNARAHLSARILAPLSAQYRHGQEVLVPVDVVGSLCSSLTFGD